MSDPPTHIEWLARRIANPDSPALDEAALARHVLDAVGALVGGATTAEGRLLLAMHRHEAGAAGRPDAGLDVMIRCAIAKSSEVDDIHRTAMVTPGAVVIPAVLTLVAAGADEARAKAAIGAGYEAMIRLGRGINGPGVLAHGIWPTYFAAPFGVAAAASCLFGLDARQIAHALALSLSYAAPSVGRPAGTASSRWLAIGQAARNGLAAAVAAQFGFVGDPAALERDAMSKTRGLEFDSGAFCADADRPVIQDISFKPWCAAKQTMSATHAISTILAEGIERDDIEEIAIGIPPAYAAMIGHQPQQGSRASHLTSLKYHAALAVCAPAALFDISQSPGKSSAWVYEFVQKITMNVVPSLQEYYPARWPAEVRVVLRSGDARTLLALSAPGDPELPLTDEQLREKFCRVSALGAAACDRLICLADGVLRERQGITRLLTAVDDEITRFSADSQWWLKAKS
jgi:2-methylcitrate dehydratase PrpD